MSRPIDLPACGDRKRSTSVLASIVVLMALTACSLVAGSDRQQCSTSKDCEAHLGATALCVAGVCTRSDEPTADGGGDAALDAGEEDPVWGCLGHPPDVPPEEPAAPIVFRGQCRDAISSDALADLPVRACKGLDGTCSQPVEGTITQTDATGAYEVPLYSGFQGYLEFLPSEKHADLMPSTMMVLPILDKRVAADEGKSLNVGLLTKTQFSFIAASGGKDVLEAYGHVFFYTSICRGSKGGADVTVRAEPISASTYTWYLDSAGTPSLTQAATSDSGNGGFINLPPGRIELTGALPDGRRIPSREVFVRAGGITFVNMAAY